MVENESKAGLRSTVIDALLEYRRTCDGKDTETFQVSPDPTFDKKILALVLVPWLSEQKSKETGKLSHED